MITRWIVWAEVNLVSCHARDQRFLCCARFCRPTGGQGVDAALSDFEDATEQVDTDHKRTASTPCAQRFARHGSTVACSCRPCLQVERQGAKPPALTRARGHPPRLQATSTDAGAPYSRPRAAQHPCRPRTDRSLCLAVRGRRLSAPPPSPPLPSPILPVRHHPRRRHRRHLHSRCHLLCCHLPCDCRLRLQPPSPPPGPPPSAAVAGPDSAASLGSPAVADRAVGRCVDRLLTGNYHRASIPAGMLRGYLPRVLHAARVDQGAAECDAED